VKPEASEQLMTYQLKDIFEMHLSRDEKLIQSSIAKLRNFYRKEMDLHHLFSFGIGDGMVVIRNGYPGHLSRIFVLDGHRKSFEIHKITAAGKKQLPKT